MEVRCQDGLGPVPHLSHDKMDVVGFLDRRDFEKHIGLPASMIFFCGVRSEVLKGKISFREREEVHPVEVRAYSTRLRKDDGLAHVFERAELADFEQPEHAVGVYEGNAAKIYLFRLDEGPEGL